MSAHFLRRAARARDSSFRLAESRRNVVVADHVELALDSASRRRGLLGRERLEAGRAMIIAPSGGVHTFGMAFPIDVVFANRQGNVLKVRHGVAPRRVALCLRAFAAIELPAGTARTLGLRPGDRVELRDVDSHASSGAQPDVLHAVDE